MDSMAEDRNVVILSDPTYEEEQQSEESSDYLRGRLEAAERNAESTNYELQRHQQALQAVLMQQQEYARQQQAQQSFSSYSASSTQQQSSDSNDPWAEYMSSINGGSRVDNEGNGQNRQLSVEEAAAVADQVAQRRISETLQAINQDAQVGNALAHRFQTQDSDLLPYSDVVASYYAANQHLPKAQAYELAVNTTRNLLQAGRLAPSSATPQSPMGGQWRTQASQPPPGMQYRRIDENLRKDELQRWTQQRKDLFEKRRQSQY